MKKRTGWQRQSESQIGGEEKRNGRLVAVTETSKERAGWRKLERKYLSIPSLLKRKGWPRCHRESCWQVCQTCLCQKGKEQSRLSRAPDLKEGIQYQSSKENISKGKKKRRVFLCRRTVRVKVKSKVILTSFPKIQERETFVGAKDRRKRDGQ